LKRPEKILVIGIGNEFRGDDAAGLIAAEKLREKNLDHVVIRFNNRDGSALLILWEGFDNVILIDAVSSDSSPGTIHTIDLHDSSFEEKLTRTSGHNFSIFETVKLAGYVDKVPSKLKLYGIEGENFGAGERPSENVLTAIDEVVELISQGSSEQVSGI